MWPARSLPPYKHPRPRPSPLDHLQEHHCFWGAGAAFGVDVVVTVAVSLATKPKPEHELRGLVWGLTETEDTSAEQDPAERVWWRRPAVLGTIALLMTALLYLVFVF
jgi:hypothetical protein